MDFEQIEDKIITELKAQIAYLRTVETYAGQIESELASMTGRFPACYVVYGGSSFDWVDGPNHQETVEFSVLVCAKNLRGNEELRKGGPVAAEYGAYDLVKAVLASLTNKDFGLDMEFLTPQKASLVFISRTVAVYGIDFKTAFDKTYA